MSQLYPYWLGTDAAPTSVPNTLPSTVTIKGTTTTAAILPTFLPIGIQNSNGFYYSTLGTNPGTNASCISSGTFYTVLLASNVPTGKYTLTYGIEAGPVAVAGSNWTFSDYITTYASISTDGTTNLQGTNTIRPYYAGIPTATSASVYSGLTDLTLSENIIVNATGQNIYVSLAAICFSNGGSNTLPVNTPALKFLTLFSPTIEKVG